jgi:WD40 repeat protein
MIFSSDNMFVSVIVLLDGRIISASDRTLNIWDPLTGKCDTVATLYDEPDSTSIRCTTVLPDGRVVIGSYDGTLRIWDSLTEKYDMMFEGQVKFVSNIFVLSDGRIISVSDHGELEIWS